MNQEWMNATKKKQNHTYLLKIPTKQEKEKKESNENEISWQSFSCFGSHYFRCDWSYNLDSV